MRVQSRDSKQISELPEFSPQSAERRAESLAPYVKLVSEFVNSIECGACSTVVYRPEGRFDQDVFMVNKARHYSESPHCKPNFAEGFRTCTT